jgi:hypothetical protein
MANTFEYATWLAMEALDLLESKRSISRFFNDDYSGEFKAKAPIGDSVQVPYPMQFSIRNGLEYTPQAITRRHATITFDQPFGVDFEWDSAEQALRAPRGREKVQKEILDPAMTQLAQEIDSRCALYATIHAAGTTRGSLDTNPSTFDTTSAACRQVMQELGCPPSGDRGIFVPPAVMRAVKGANLTQFNPVQDISKMNRTGIIAQSDGFDWYESMSLYAMTAGTISSTNQLAANAANGATTLSLTCSTSDTYHAGDKFTIAAVRPVHPLTKRTFAAAATLKTFTVTESTVGAASAATIKISPPIYYTGPYQNVDAQPLAAAALVMWPGTTTPNAHTGQVGLALHRNAFALVGVELEEPKGSSVEIVTQKRDPDSGMSVRFVRQWDNKSSKFTNRFDCMIGLGEFFTDSCAVVIPCA